MLPPPAQQDLVAAAAGSGLCAGGAAEADVLMQCAYIVRKVFRNIAIFPTFRHLAKMEKKCRRLGYKMST